MSENSDSCLYVRFSTILSNGSLVSMWELHFQDLVTVVRTGQKKLATTWEKGSLGIVGFSKRQAIGRELDDLLDGFVLDYLRANPKN